MTKKQIGFPIFRVGKVRYSTKINVRVPRLRASPRHGGPRRFNIYSLKPPRGRPVGGGGGHRVQGYGGISPHFYSTQYMCYPFKIAMSLLFQPIANDEERKKGMENIVSKKYL